MFRSNTLLAIAALLLCAACPRADEALVPVIDGDWWQVAGNPDLGEYTSEKQQPVDFAVWQAADGTWQLWSCIRHTKCGGHTRLLYGWEGAHLTDSDWRPLGITWMAKPELGEAPGGMQAPHVVRHDGLYWMAYGDWNHICFATSEDGKQFERVIQPGGATGVFWEGPDANTRDPMLIRIDGLWHCYYCGFPEGKCRAYVRTSPDLRTWGPSCVVSYGGLPGTTAGSAECPHVVEYEPGLFYFFRNQYYGEGQRNWVYLSGNPLNFGIDSNRALVGSLPVAAPEIVQHENQYYIAALNTSLDGIRIARLKWVPRAQSFVPVFMFDDAEARAAWTLKAGKLPSVFTTSRRVDFGAWTEHFIGTAETDGERFNDGMHAVIESPAFTIKFDTLYVRVSGGLDPRYLYVSLVDLWNGEEIARVSGHNGNTMRMEAVSCAGHVGNEAIVRIVDHTGVPWGHINFGGLYYDAQ